MSDHATRQPLEPKHVEAVIPLHAEVVRVDTREIETGRVRVVKTVRQEECVIDRPLAREEYDVQRVAVNRVVAEPPPLRHEGDTIVVPVLEEVLVVEKRLVLREEIRLVPRRTVENHKEVVTLRTEQAQVQRVPPEHPAPRTPK